MNHLNKGQNPRMSSLASVSTRHYFKSIDGLRLFAAANIVLFHLEGLGGLNQLQGSPGWLFSIIKGPTLHASLFFILGGFIYTIKYAAHVQDFSTRRFLRSRFKNLFTLHAATTVAMAVLLVVRQGWDQVSLPRLIFSLGMHLSMLWSFFPFFSYTFNTPSWAISAFMFCYIVFKPAMVLLVRVEQRRQLFGLIGVALLVMTAWATLFGALGCPANMHTFFHVFGPYRFCEFFIGMVLARFFQVRTYRKQGRKNRPSILIDAMFIGFLYLAFLNVSHRSMLDAFGKWTAYHVLLVPVFGGLVWCMAQGRGLIARFMALNVVREMGKGSFYPYLLHVPLVSWICWISERYFGYYQLLHSPLNIVLFLLLLYGISSIYLIKRGKKRRSSYKVAS